jgi:hypothetical protein
VSLDLLALIGKAQRDAVRKAAESQAALARTNAHIAEAEQQSGMELRSPAGSPVSANPATRQEGLFRAEFAARSAEQRAAATLALAVEKLSTVLDEFRSAESESRAELEAARADLSQTMAAAAEHKHQVSQLVARERAAIDDKGESFYQGCACGLGLGCLGLAGYVVLTIVMIFTGRQSGPDSPFGAVFLTLFVVPIGVAAILQILYGLKRMMVEAEMKAKLRAADELCEKVVERAKSAHSGIEPGLELKLREAEAAAKKAQAALACLTGPPDAAPDATSS